MSRPPGPGRGNKRTIGNGDGWGGPANGASGKPLRTGREAAKILHSMPKEIRTYRRAERADRAERMLDIIDNLAENAEREETRLAAAVKFRAEVVGQPVQRNVNFDGGDISAMDERQLDAELERARTAVAATEAAATDPIKPNGVVH